MLLTEDERPYFEGIFVCMTSYFRIPGSSYLLGCRWLCKRNKEYGSSPSHYLRFLPPPEPDPLGV